MADITKALPGMKISDRARKRLVKAFGERHADLIPATVSAKGANPSGAGQWACIDCGELPQNNAMAWFHADKHSERTPHRFAWRNGDTGNWEEP